MKKLYKFMTLFHFLKLLFFRVPSNHEHFMRKENLYQGKAPFALPTSSAFSVLLNLSEMKYDILIQGRCQKYKS